MKKKIVLNITDTPVWAKALPFTMALAGIALAKYQKKDCIGCYLGYSLTAALFGSLPLVKIAYDKGTLDTVKMKEASPEGTAEVKQKTAEAVS